MASRRMSSDRMTATLYLFALLALCCFRTVRAQDDAPAAGTVFSPSALRTPVPQIGEAEFEALVHGPMPILVDFFAPWCGHCKTMAPLYEAAAVQMRTQDPAALTQLVKVDCMQERSLCARFGINSFPAIKLIRRTPGEGDGLRVYEFAMQRTTLGFLVFCSTVWRTLPFEPFPELGADQANALRAQFERERAGDQSGESLRSTQVDDYIPPPPPAPKPRRPVPPPPTLKERWEAQEREAGRLPPLPVTPDPPTKPPPVPPQILEQPPTPAPQQPQPPQQQEQQNAQAGTPAAALEPSPEALAAAAQAGDQSAEFLRGFMAAMAMEQARKSAAAAQARAGVGIGVSEQRAPAAAVAADGVAAADTELAPPASDAAAGLQAEAAVGSSSKLLWILGIIAVIAAVGGVVLRRHWGTLRKRINRHHSLQLSKDF